MSDFISGLVLEAPDAGRVLHIHSGLLPLTAQGATVGQDSTPTAVIAALQHNTAITLSRVRTWHLGRYRGLTADVTLRFRRNAPAQYLIHADPYVKLSLSVRPGMRARLYLARVVFPYGPDGVDFVAEAPTPTFTAWDRIVRRIIATARLRGVSSG